MKIIKFWEGWRQSLLNVLEEATLAEHLLNLIIIVTYPIAYVLCFAYVKLQTKKTPN
jgi:hypothetical protein